MTETRDPAQERLDDAPPHGEPPNDRPDQPRHDAPRWICLDDVEEIEPSWLWKGRIPEGEITNVTGPDGVGKTALAVYVVASLTSGRPLYGHTEPCDPRRAVWISTEESVGKVRRRLRKAGAVLGNVIALNNGERWTTKEVDELRRVVLERDVKVVVIDAIADAVPGDANNPSEVRPGLVPLVAAAHEIGVPVLGLRHWGKSTRDARGRSSGAHSWRDLARCQICVAEHDGGRVCAWEKLSDAEKPPALRFELQDRAGDPVFVIVGEAPGVTADDLAKDEPSSREERTALDDAVEFLRGELADGPRSQPEILQAARSAGVTESTLRRAKARLGVTSERDRAGSGQRVTGWRWALHDQGALARARGRVVDDHLEREGGNSTQHHHATSDSLGAQGRKREHLEKSGPEVGIAPRIDDPDPPSALDDQGVDHDHLEDSAAEGGTATDPGHHSLGDQVYMSPQGGGDHLERQAIPGLPEAVIRTELRRGIWRGVGVTGQEIPLHVNVIGALAQHGLLGEDLPPARTGGAS